jgi:hypothetical protein
MQLRNHALPTFAAMLLIVSTPAASQVCSDGAHPSYTQYNYLDGGLVVHVAKIDRGTNVTLENSFWKDHDWSYQIRSASCIGQKFGKDCNTERQRFVAYFWDQQNSDWQSDTVGYLNASRTQCGLVGNTTRDLWIDANSTAYKYACQLDNFTDHQLVEAEVSVSNANYLDERKDLGGLLDQMSFSSSLAVPCYEPTNTRGLCGHDVLMYGMVVSDNNHGCGKPEVHPVHAVVTESVEPGIHTSSYDATYTSYLFADYGKAAGYGVDLSFDHIDEYWNRDHVGSNGAAQAYANVEPNWVRPDIEAQVRSRATPSTFSFASLSACPSSASVPVHDHGRLSFLISPPTATRLATPTSSVPALVTGRDCAGIQFWADFTADGDYVGGAQRASAGQFTKGGFAAVVIQPRWDVTDVTHFGDVKKVRLAKGIAPGGDPNANYFEITGSSRGRISINNQVVNDVALDEIDWCLPNGTIVAQEIAERAARPTALGPRATSTSPKQLGPKTSSLIPTDLPCYPGHALGLSSITFYVPEPPLALPSLLSSRPGSQFL